MVDRDAADAILQFVKLNLPRPAFIRSKGGQCRTKPLRPLHGHDTGLLQKLWQGNGLGGPDASRQPVQVHVPERSALEGVRLNEGKGRAGHFRRIETKSRRQTFHELRFPAAEFPTK